MRYRKTENTMSLLGGALLGAAAMYLLDPEMGRKRRETLKDQAGDYAGSAGDALQSGWGKVSEGARGVGQTLADKAETYGQKLSDLAHEYSERLADHAKDAGSSWSDTARDAGASLTGTLAGLRAKGAKLFGRYADKAQDYASDRASNYSDMAGDAADNITDYGNHLWKQVRGLGNKLNARARDASDDARHSLAGEDESSVALPITATAVGCCALGVGLMYLMDPQRGRSRRAWLVDKLTSSVRHTGQSFYRTGQDLANRAQGVAYETRGRYLGAGPTSSEQLRDRVRSAMGRVVSEPRLVQVMADANGSVTLSGSVRHDEADRLVSTIEGVPGVILLINRLDVTRESSAGGSAPSASNQGVPQM